MWTAPVRFDLATLAANGGGSGIELAVLCQSIIGQRIAILRQPFFECYLHERPPRNLVSGELLEESPRQLRQKCPSYRGGSLPRWKGNSMAHLNWRCGRRRPCRHRKMKIMDGRKRHIPDR